MRYYQGEVGSIIPAFSNYEVTTYGRVVNRTTGREMVLSPTVGGELTVGLMKYGVQFRRSVKVLVAEAFVPGRSDIFNTPIQLDGDRNNLTAGNIAWRPRWFAWEYTHQFHDFRAFHHIGPILDITNGIEYETIFQASIATGSLAKHIHGAITSKTHVFPGGEKYVYI